MPSVPRLPRRFDITRRPFLLFAVAVLLPGVVLAILAVGSFRQDRRLAEQELRDDCERAADRALETLGSIRG